MKRFALTLDLKDDEALIREYEELHKQIWPGIKKTIVAAGIIEMEIYRLHTRLFMIMETQDDFSFERKSKMDSDNPLVQKWEEFVWKYQQPVAGSKPGEKWILMNKIYQLTGS